MRRRPIGNGTCAPHIPREVAALIAALQLKGATGDDLLALEEQEWETLLTFCDVAHLTLPLALALTGINGLPPWVAERLKKNLADNAARFTRVEATYREAAAALDQAEVEYVVLKGFTQIPDYVSEARFRMQSDLDLYCPKEMIDRAREALISIGYQSEPTIDYSRADHLPTMTRKGGWQWSGNMFDPEMPLSIELHFCLWNQNLLGFHVPETENFWKRRVRRSLRQLSFPALCPVDHLGYLSLHAVRGLLTGDWIIHHVYELAAFLHLRAKDDAFWSTWREMHSNALRELEAIAFFHAQSWFCCELHSNVQAQIAMLPSVHREWLRRFAGSSLEGMFRKNSDRAWLHANLVQPAGRKLKVITEATIPMRVGHIPSVGSTTVRVKNRQPRQSQPSNRYVQYAVYLFDRLINHGRNLPSAVLHGLTFWASLRQQGKELHQ